MSLIMQKLKEGYLCGNKYTTNTGAPECYVDCRSLFNISMTMKLKNISKGYFTTVYSGVFAVYKLQAQTNDTDRK